MTRKQTDKVDYIRFVSVVFPSHVMNANF